MIAIKDPHASYQLLSRELQNRGFIFDAFELAGEPVMSLVSPHGKTWLTRLDRISYPLNTGFHANIVRSKYLSYELAKHQGFSVAQTTVVDNHQLLGNHEAAALIRQCGGCVIVKPESASLSRGLTRNITTASQLLSAIEYAQAAVQASAKILIQQQIVGEEIRFIVVNGQVVGALLRDKPKLIGDGRSTIATLLERENHARDTLQDTMVAYPLLTPDMCDAAVEMDRVPIWGEVIELSQATMIKDGASMYDVLKTIHPSYVAAVEAFVQSFGIGFVAVDIFITDYIQPMTDHGTYFNEFNNAPVLKLCYSCRDGNHIDIVPILADAIEKRIHA